MKTFINALVALAVVAGSLAAVPASARQNDHLQGCDIKFQNTSNHSSKYLVNHCTTYLNRQSVVGYTEVNGKSYAVKAYMVGDQKVVGQFGKRRVDVNRTTGSGYTAEELSNAFAPYAVIKGIVKWDGYSKLF